VPFVFCVCVLCAFLCLTLVHVLPHCLAQGKYKFAQSFKRICELNMEIHELDSGFLVNR
jgi:hypothetical protein